MGMKTEDHDVMPDEHRGPASFGMGVLVGVAIAAMVAGGLIGFQAGKTQGHEAPSAPVASTGPPMKLKIGETADIPTGSQVTVITWEDGTPPGWPPTESGLPLSQAVVRFCAAPGGWNYRIRQLPFHFNLVAQDGTLVDPITDLTYSQDEFASYNVGVVSSDECATGTVVFKPSPSPVTAVQFSGFQQVDWDVSAISSGASPAPDPGDLDFGVQSKGGQDVPSV